MGRHKVPRYNRRRLVIAGATALTMIGVTVGIGIYGSAFAEDEPVAAASGPCLPDVADAAANPSTPPPPDTSEPAPAPEGANGEKGPAPADQPPPPDPLAQIQTFGGQGCVEQLGPFPEDFVNIRRVPPVNLGVQPGRNASTGTFVSPCGTNGNGHNNPDNFIVTPGVANGAHHLHDYVGNLTTDNATTDESLQAGGTTCRNGDLSTYFWPVLRVRNRGSQPDATNPHNVGTVLRPSSALLQFRGNAKAKVVAMPQVLRMVTGDAKAATNGPANANAKWTCSGFGQRFTIKYPICPRGSAVQRVLNFPSCWDGQNTDSANHRTHVVFPGRNGACPQGTQPIPQLRMTLTYNVPRGQVFALDAFPEQLHDPITDHADFANVMPAGLMQRAVDCINFGRRC